MEMALKVDGPTGDIFAAVSELTFAEIISLKLSIDLPSITALMHHVTVM